MTELAEGGDLYNRNKENPLDYYELKKAIWEICLVLKFLKDHKIIHRNLSLHNILLTKDGTIKIASFD